jgi:hypothetical protein
MPAVGTRGFEHHRDDHGEGADQGMATPTQVAQAFSSAVLFVALAACQRAAPPGAPAPRVGCAEPVGATRLLGAEPVVPFAWISAPGIVEAGAACCAPFSQANGYYAVDPWGKASGPFRVEGYEDYDITRCRELTLGGAPTNAVLYTSQPLPEQARPLPASPELVRVLDVALATIEARYAVRAAAAPELPELSRRTLLFEWRVGNTTARYGVVGGDILVVFRLEAQATPLCVLDEERESGFYYPYRPRGVAQLDASPEPELVIRESEGPSWNDAVLSLGGKPCEIRARSVGGSTG